MRNWQNNFQKNKYCQVNNAAGDVNNDFNRYTESIKNFKIIESENGLNGNRPWKPSRSKPCHDLWHLPLDQVTQIPTQPDLEHLLGQDIHTFSEQSVTVPHRSLTEEFLSYI